MNERAEKGEKNKDSLRITHQTRERNGMVYDLKGDGNRLTLRVFPRENSSDAADWRVEARTSEAQAAMVVSAWGATRAEALSSVAGTWTSKGPAQGLPAFDWEDVARVLTAVRAL
jgi:hypothetical protein